MISVECIDELADYAGLKAEVAAVTERAMRGELAFEGALRERVALLKGLDELAIDRCRDERVRLTPGARALVRTMRGATALTVLVSGGFTRFAEPVGAEIGFDRVIANRLESRRRPADRARSPSRSSAREAKRAALLDAAAERGLETADALAVGDGANDMPMIAGGRARRRLSRQAGRSRCRGCWHRPQRSDRFALCAGLCAERVGAGLRPLQPSGRTTV